MGKLVSCSDKEWLACITRKFRPGESPWAKGKLQERAGEKMYTDASLPLCPKEPGGEDQSDRNCVLEGSTITKLALFIWLHQLFQRGPCLHCTQSQAMASSPLLYGWAHYCPGSFTPLIWTLQRQMLGHSCTLQCVWVNTCKDKGKKRIWSWKSCNHAPTNTLPQRIIGNSILPYAFCYLSQHFISCNTQFP